MKLNKPKEPEKPDAELLKALATADQKKPSETKTKSASKLSPTKRTPLVKPVLEDGDAKPGRVLAVSNSAKTR